MTTLRKKIRRTLVLSGTLLCHGAPTRAATYNFYFNNTEPGSNATAAPSLSVPSGAVPGSPPVYPPPANSPAPAQIPVEQGAASNGEAVSRSTLPPNLSDNNLSESVVSARYRVPARTSRDIVRVGIAGAVASTVEVDPSDFGEVSAQFYDHQAFEPALVADLSLLPSRYLSLNGWGMLGGYRGWAWGADARIIPVRVGFFGMENFLQISAGVGLTSLAARADNFASGYLVANVNFGLGMEDVFLSATAKGNAGFLMGEAGIGYRF